MFNSIKRFFAPTPERIVFYTKLQDLGVSTVWEFHLLREAARKNGVLLVQAPALNRATPVLHHAIA